MQFTLYFFHIWFWGFSYYKNWRYWLKKLQSTIYMEKWIKTHQQNKSIMQNQVKLGGKQNNKMKHTMWERLSIIKYSTHLHPFIELTLSSNLKSYVHPLFPWIVFLDPQHVTLTLAVVDPKWDVIYKFVSGLLSEISLVTDL